MTNMRISEKKLQEYLDQFNKFEEDSRANAEGPHGDADYLLTQFVREL